MNLLRRSQRFTGKARLVLRVHKEIQHQIALRFWKGCIVGSRCDVGNTFQMRSHLIMDGEEVDRNDRFP